MQGHVSAFGGAAGAAGRVRGRDGVRRKVEPQRKQRSIHPCFLFSLCLCGSTSSSLSSLPHCQIDFRLAMWVRRHKYIPVNTCDVQPTDIARLPVIRRIAVWHHLTQTTLPSGSCSFRCFFLRNKKSLAVPYFPCRGHGARMVAQGRSPTLPDTLPRLQKTAPTSSQPLDSFRKIKV
jgi:hypothetical protein